MLTTTHPTRLLLLLTLILFITSCENTKREYVIGVSQCSEDIWREKQNKELTTSAYADGNARLEFATALDNDQRQIEQIDSFVKQGVDLLIVCPNQYQTIAPAIGRAYDKGIPVILFERKTATRKYTAYIGADNYKVGYTMGKYVAKCIRGHGSVVEIKGLKGSSPALERHNGFADALSHYPGIKLTASRESEWTEASGRKAMEEILQQTHDIDCVFGQNDRLCDGARQVLHQHGIDKGVKFFGVDGLPGPDGGIERVRQGLMEATYLYPTRGTDLFKLALRILEHKPFPRETTLQSALVTKENADILLLQDIEVQRQSENIDALHQQMDKFLQRYSNYRTVAILSGVILVLLIVFLITFYRLYLSKSRLNDELSARNDELQRLTAEVEQMTQDQLAFFTNVSHELRTPLTLISGPLGQLLADNSVNVADRQLLQMMKRNVSLLTRLVNEILDFRKVQSGKMRLKMSRFNLKDELREWCHDFGQMAHSKNITLTLDTTHTTDGAIEADRGRVAHVYQNLMSNAMKYTPTGGTVNTKLLEDDINYTLIVEDTGKGIAADEVGHVFERFYQAKGSAGGTGIGLALVKGLVELHGGSVSVSSKVGRGSRFTVMLPKRQEGFVAKSASQDETPALPSNEYIDTSVNKSQNADDVVASQQTEEKPEVLVIDDNSDMREYLRSILKDRYHVIEAADGQQGLEVARKRVPDIVVSDVMMPVMDGMEFTRQLKDDTATSHIPVILLTARTLDEYRMEGYEHGADSYIVKPFSPNLLLVRIDNMLKAKERISRHFSIEAADREVEKPQQQPRTCDEEFLSNLRDAIQTKMGDSELSVEDIGAEVGLSRVQLYRKVKALTGHTPVELLRSARLHKGRELLLTTTKSISEVAYAVGFTSPSYFTKCFKEEFGVLPGEVK